MKTTPHKLKSRQGYTLVEVMIVTGMILLLASLAIPAFMRSRSYAQATKVASDFKMFSGLYAQYALETGSWPPDAAPGVIPTGMEDHLSDVTPDWDVATAIGGNWDWVRGSSGSGRDSGVSISGSAIIDADAEKIDELLDDGDLTSGIFQKAGGGLVYYMDL